MECGKEAVEKVLSSRERARTGSAEYCEKHQAEFDYLPNTYELACPVCYRQGREAERQQLAIRSAHEELNLPPRLAAVSFDSYQPSTAKAKKALEMCREFAANPGGGLILIGDVGTGKTHLAASICKTLADRGQKCRLVTVPQIIREIRATWRDGADETEQGAINRYGSYPLLCIDEIGTMYGSDAEKITLTEIINQRYNNMLPTVIMGNVSLSEAENYLGIRVIDRLRHGGKVVVFDWESWRRKN